MGILGDLGLAFGQTVVTAVETEFNEKNSLENKTRQNNMMYKLFVKQRKFALKESFYIYEEYKKKKYLIRTDFINIFSRTIRLFSMNGRELGSVVKKKGLFADDKYHIYLDGEEIGTATPSTSFNLKDLFNLDFNDWHISREKVFGERINIFDTNGEIVVRLDYALKDDTYIIEFNNPMNELLGILLVVLTQLYSQSIYDN